jgi:hypothetical protein
MRRRSTRSVAQVRTLDRGLLTDLQRCRAYPSVSVLLTTSPGPVLASGDAVRLYGLLERAQRRLSSEAADDTVDTVVARLRALALAVRRSPTDRGLALFASESRAEAVHLGVMVDDRVVVDPTFATRDLVRAFHANPRYRLLVLSEHRARFFEGWSTALSEVTTGGFPLSAGHAPNRHDRSRHFGRERSDRRDAALRAQVRAIDVALAARRACEPLPLVVAGGPRQLALFRETSSEAGSMVGEIRGSHERTPIARLAARCLPVIDVHREAERRAALARLEDVRARARLVQGIHAVWAAAVEGHIGLLCVEEGFTLPARVVSGGRRLMPAADVEHPEVLDDTIDELIELVSVAGGEIVLVENEALASRQRIAALRYE